MAENDDNAHLIANMVVVKLDEGAASVQEEPAPEPTSTSTPSPTPSISPTPDNSPCDILVKLEENAQIVPENSDADDFSAAIEPTIDANIIVPLGSFVAAASSYGYPAESLSSKSEEGTPNDSDPSRSSRSLDWGTYENVACTDPSICDLISSPYSLSVLSGMHPLASYVYSAHPGTPFEKCRSSYLRSALEEKIPDELMNIQPCQFFNPGDDEEEQVNLTDIDIDENISFDECHYLKNEQSSETGEASPEPKIVANAVTPEESEFEIDNQAKRVKYNKCTPTISTTTKDAPKDAVPSFYKTFDPSNQHKEESSVFDCTHCEYSATTKKNLREHLIIHCDERQFKCPYCPYKSKHNAGLRAHLTVHSAEKPFQCTLCSYKCKRKQNLIQHSKVHFKARQYRKYSDYEGNTKKTIRKHRSENTSKDDGGNNRNDTFECLVCKDKFSCKKDLSTHFESHSNENVVSSTQEPFETPKSSTSFDNFHQCPHCDFNSPRKCALKNHIKSHTKDQYRCLHCKFKCKILGSMRLHMTSHTSDVLLHCAVCPFTSRFQNTLLEHIKSHETEDAKQDQESSQHHEPEDDYKCPYCSFVTTMAEILKVHISNHSDDLLRSFGKCHSQPFPAEESSNSEPTPISPNQCIPNEINRLDTYKEQNTPQHGSEPELPSPAPNVPAVRGTLNSKESSYQCCPSPNQVKSTEDFEPNDFGKAPSNSENAPLVTRDANDDIEIIKEVIKEIPKSVTSCRYFSKQNLCNNSTVARTPTFQLLKAAQEFRDTFKWRKYRTDTDIDAPEAHPNSESFPEVKESVKKIKSQKHPKIQKRKSSKKSLALAMKLITEEMMSIKIGRIKKRTAGYSNPFRVLPQKSNLLYTCPPLQSINEEKDLFIKAIDSPQGKPEPQPQPEGENNQCETDNDSTSNPDAKTLPTFASVFKIFTKQSNECGPKEQVSEQSRSSLKEGEDIYPDLEENDPLEMSQPPEPPPENGTDEDYTPVVKKETSNYTCKICYATYQLERSLVRHLKSRHNSIHCSKRKCSIECKKRLITNCRDHPKEIFRCTKCPFKSYRKCSLLSHFRIHSQKYQCQHCGFECHFIRQLETHSQIHEEDMSIKCPYCEFGAPRCRVLKQHIKKHYKDNPYVCKECDLRYDSLKSWKVHMASFSHSLYAADLDLDEET